ncbi:unnamed protein product [Amoebophrya sp. A120]|nr:unnamed protein product [Amoebophrya sp. A120]|eukprot:GSA120T00004893001.1
MISTTPMPSHPLNSVLSDRSSGSARGAGTGPQQQVSIPSTSTLVPPPSPGTAGAPSRNYTAAGSSVFGSAAPLDETRRPVGQGHK